MISLHITPKDSGAEAIDRRITDLVDAELNVIHVTVRRAYSVLKRSAPAGVFYIDATGAEMGATYILPNCFFVESKTALEVIAVRLRMALKRLGDESVIVIEDLATIVSANGLEVAGNYVHYLRGMLGSGSNIEIYYDDDDERVPSVIGPLCDTVIKA